MICGLWFLFGYIYIYIKVRQICAPTKSDNFCKQKQLEVLFCQQIWGVSNLRQDLIQPEHCVCTINELLFNISFSPYCSRHGTKALVMVPFKPCGGDRITNIYNTHHSSITNTHLFIIFKCPIWFIYLFIFRIFSIIQHFVWSGNNLGWILLQE